MHRTRWIVGMTMLGAALTTAQPQAQTNETGPGNEPASSRDGGDGGSGGLKPFAWKKAACREAGARTGLRGADLADHVQLCFEEAKLACLKQAITRKVRGPERRSFIQTCTDSIN